jgi:hypothetical protein
MPVELSAEDGIIRKLVLNLLHRRDYYLFAAGRVKNPDMTSYFTDCADEKGKFAKEILLELREHIKTVIEVEYQTREGERFSVDAGLTEIIDKCLDYEKQTAKIYEEGFRSCLPGRLKSKMATQYYNTRLRTAELEEMKHADLDFFEMGRFVGGSY